MMSLRLLTFCSDNLIANFKKSKAKKHLFICFLLSLSVLAYTQPSVLHSNITSTTPASLNNRWTLNTISNFRQFRFQANDSGNFTWAFSLGTPAAPDYSMNWRPNTTGNVMSYNTFIPTGWANGALYNISNAGADGIINNIQNGYYYTFNVGINASADNVMEVLETSYNPTVISSCTSSWGTFGQRTVNIVLATAPQAGENVFLRYTTGGINFPTSNYVQVTMTGNTGTAIIPAQAAGSTVHYYAYTSNRSKSAIDADIAAYGQPSHDMATLNISGVLASYLMPASPVIVTSTLGSQANIATGYATLQAAFTAINGASLHLGSISIAIMGNTTEPASAILNQVAGVTSVGIQPAGGAARTISGNFAGPVIDLNGADFVTIDGRDGGTGTTKALTVTNTIGGAGYAIRFIQDALNNTVRYCDLIASPSGVGIVTFSTASGTGVGNDNNSINTCNLYGLVGSNPVYGVYSSGTGSPRENSGDTIANCNIYNFRANAGTPAGVYLTGANSSWTIDGNSFYQTAAYAGPGNMVIYGININSATYSGFAIKNNYIGGGAPQCSGTAWTINGTAQSYQFNGIKISCGTGTNYLEGNTIKNFLWLTTNSGTAPGAWTGIYSWGSGNLNIGTTTKGNTIGDNNTNSINITLNTNSGGTFYGIYNESSGSVNTKYNTIGSMTSNGSTAAISASLVGIYSANGTNNISYNTIGSATTSSMNCSNASSNATSQFIKGIVLNPNAVVSTAQIISNNTISNLNNNYAVTTTAATNRGISIEPLTATNLTGSVTINGNTINNIITSQNAAGAGISNNIAGIYMSGTSCSSATIQGNTISALKATGGSAAVTVAGILYNGPAGASTISKNLIFGLETPNSTSTTAAVYGIRANAGTTTYSNNIISLGSTNGRGQINGFYDGGGTNNIYHNTVSITGTSVVATTNSALNTATTNTRNIRNNIFYCTRTGGTANRSVTISSTTGLTIGLNDYFGTLSGIALNVAPDNNSLAIDPLFPLPTGIAATDFIPAATTLNGANLIATIGDDIDGTLRCVPTMGAQEYRISPTSVTATASPNPICTGNTLTLTGTATGATSYSWSGPNGFSPTTLSGSITNVTTLAAGVFTLTATNSCGSTAASTASVVVNTTPSMTTTPTAYTICSGDSSNIPLTASSGASISWVATENGNVGGESTTPTSTALINDVLTNTTANVQTVVYTATALTASCSSSEQFISISVNPAVNITLDPSIDSNTQTISSCGNIGGGGQVVINIWSGDISNSTYSWQYSNVSNTGPWTTDSTSTNQYNISSFSSLLGNHYFRLLLTANGITCTSDVITLIVTEIAPLAPTGTGATRCSTGTFTLSASGCSGTLNWFDVPFGGTSLGSAATFVTPSISTTTTYYVSCTVGTCESQRTAVVATVQMPSPLSISISTAATTICMGESTTFTASPVNGGATPSYQWQVNGGNVGTNSSSFTSTTLVNGDIITCFITSSDSCTSGSPAISNSITMTVNPIQAVSVSINASLSSICSGTNVTFTATPTNGGLTPSFQWKLNGVNVGSNSSTYSNSTLANGDVITCVLTSNIACPTGNPATSNSINMVVGSTVSTPVFGLGTTSTRCQGVGTVTYSASATNSTGITYSLDTASLAGSNTINVNTGTVTYSAAWSGSTIITATATGCNGPKYSTHVVTINPSVGVPVFTIGPTSSRCGAAGTVTYTAAANNSTGITYLLDAASTVAGNTINSSTGIVTYVAGWTGTSTITARAVGCNGPKNSIHLATTIPSPTTSVIYTLPNLATGNDITCSNEVREYEVQNTLGSIYSWSIITQAGGNGFITSGNGTNSISINWTSPGTAILQVIETNTSGCVGTPVTILVTIIINNTINLTSTEGTDNQTVCINSSLTNITYSTFGATGATISGLPTGVSGFWDSNVVTISGSPSVSGLYTYNITLTEGCGVVSISGSMNVLPNNQITLTSDVGTDNQAVCINSSLTNITYSTFGATGVSISGLPVGVYENLTSDLLVISGTPVISGTFNYTVTLTGGCGISTATGTLLVHPLNTISLISSPGTDNQTMCFNRPITNITYSYSGATGANISGLPEGINGFVGDNEITITGIPLQSGLSTYTISLTGGCLSENISGTINVNPEQTISLTSATGTANQTVCNNSNLNDITFHYTGISSLVVTGLPAGVHATNTSDTIKISGTPSSPGNYIYNLTFSNGCGESYYGYLDVNPIPASSIYTNSPICSGNEIGLLASPDGMQSYHWTGPTGFLSTLQNPTIPNALSANSGMYSLMVTDTNGCFSSTTALVQVNPGSVGGSINGGGTIYEGISTVNLQLIGYSGNILYWQKQFNQGEWTTIPLTSSTYSETPNGVGTWKYRALVQNNGCQEVFSSEAIVNVIYRTLLIKVYLEGLYDESIGQMNKAQNESGNAFTGLIADMITVCLGKNSPPYSYEYVITDIGLPRNGIFTINLPPGSTSSYYLVVKHRNSIETWSSYPVSLHAGQTTYNFTNGAQKAYGYNLNQVGSVWVIYGGDVDQDGIVDSSDMIPTENQTSSFSMGYLPEDVNGDGLIDSSDMILIENNVSEFVTKVVPF